MIKTLWRTGLLAAALLAGRSQAAETILFQENFDTAASADNWDIFAGSDSGTEDYTVDFGFDYGNTMYTSNSVAFKIPPAPNGTGTTGLKVTVNNNDDTAERAAVNLYSKGQTFSGNFALKFDMWINYNGGAYGGTGSTEFAIFGINFFGTQPNWDSTGATDGALFTSDGLMFAVTGEAGAARDFRTYLGDFAGAPLEFQGVSGGYLDLDGTGTPDQDKSIDDSEPASYGLNLVFPNPPFESKGVPGKQWVQVEVRQRDGVVTWLMNGFTIAELPAFSSEWIEGEIMLGAMDIFTSIANPRADNFFLFDNVRVVSLDDTAPLPRVTIAATNPAASEPSTPALFTITRDGDTTAALTVSIASGGTAISGLDYQAVPATVTIPAGESSVEVPVTVIDDQIGEPAESVWVNIVGNPGQYEVYAPLVALAEITDDNDVTTINVATADAHSYEKIPTDTAAFRISRVGDISGDQTVNFTLGGTAVAGTDYQNPGTSAVIVGGEDSVLVKIVPIDNNTIDADKTVTLTLAAGTGYVLGTTTSGTATIRNDDLAPGQELFSDDFETDTTGNWNVLAVNEGQSFATFNWDYLENAGIPAAPNSGGTTHGLKLEANTGDTPTFTGISVSPIDQGFTGDYRLRFDMWINFPGPLDLGGTGSTELLTAGMGVTGDVAQFPGTSVQGVMFAATGDGGAAQDYRVYTATGAPLHFTNGVYAAGTSGSPEPRNNSHPYYAPFGGATAPETQLSMFPQQTLATSQGALGSAWHEVVITKIGDTFTWDIDAVRIATVELTNKEISTNIFLGFFDFNTTQATDLAMQFGVVDNLVVESIESSTPVEINITGIQALDANQVQIDFTVTGTPGTLSVLSSDSVVGTFTPETNAQITTVSPGVMRAVIPATSPARFFVIRNQ